MSNQDRDPRDEIDERAMRPQAQRPRNGQQVISPNDALGDPTLAVDLARVEIDQAIATAHKFPRQLPVVVSQMRQLALYDEASASRCVYMLPRAEKAIVGPSIGFANMLATCWGNCVDTGRWLRTDRVEKVVVCEGIFVDLQTNRRVGVSVTRRISTSKGMLYNDDMRAVTAQAGTSIARRNAILNGVPPLIWRPIYEEALIVVRGTLETLAERRDKLVAAFAGFGVTPERLFMALGIKEAKEITLDHIVMLRGMFEALKDGTVSPSEMFDPRRMLNAAFEEMKNPLGADDDDDDEQDDGAPPQKQQRRQPDSAADQAKGPAKPESADRKTAAHHDDLPAEDAGNAPAKADDKPAGKAASAKPDKPPAASAEPAEVLPKSTGEYKGYARGKFATFKAQLNETALETWWKSKAQRDLRGACSVISADLDGLTAEKAKTVAEIREAKAGAQS